MHFLESTSLPFPLPQWSLFQSLKGSLLGISSSFLQFKKEKPHSSISIEPKNLSYKKGTSLTGSQPVGSPPLAPRSHHFGLLCLLLGKVMRILLSSTFLCSGQTQLWPFWFYSPSLLPDIMPKLPAISTNPPSHQDFHWARDYLLIQSLHRESNNHSGICTCAHNEH